MSTSEAPSILDVRLAQLLQAQGLVQSESVADALTILPFTHSTGQYEELFERAAKSLLTISLAPAEKILAEYKASHPNILFFSGPFTSRRLDEILAAASSTYMARRKPLPIAEETLSLRVCTETRPNVPRFDSVAAEHLYSRLDTMTLNAPTPNCLLVDDNLINLRIMRMYCETRKFPYTTALDGLQAVEKYKAAIASAPINLILLDLQMPNCDGIEACKQIRALESQEGLLPAVIFIG